MSITVNVPFRNRAHGNVAVMVDTAFWEHGDNNTKPWQILGIPNEKNVGNYVVCGDVQRHPEYMHVSVYTFYNPEQMEQIRDKGNQIDHTHSDPFDNRIQSLQLVTRAQNLSARRGRRDSSSAYKGVSMKRKKTATSTAADKWICQFNDKTCMTKRMRVQSLPTSFDAAKLFNKFVHHFQPACGFKNNVCDNDGVLQTHQIEALYQTMLKKHRDGGFLLRSK